MNRFKHANWWRSYLGKLSKDFGRLQAWISSGNTSTSNGEEENRVRKTEWRKQLQSFFALLRHFPKSIFCILYTIWNLRKSIIQRFKPCMIWSWNEEDMAFGRQLHHVKWPISQGDFLHGAKFCHFAPWRPTLRKFRKVDLGTLQNSFESPILRRCWWYSTADSPRYFAWFLALQIPILPL